MKFARFTPPIFLALVALIMSSCSRSDEEHISYTDISYYGSLDSVGTQVFYHIQDYSGGEELLKDCTEHGTPMFNATQMFAFVPATKITGVTPIVDEETQDIAAYLILGYDLTQDIPRPLTEGQVLSVESAYTELDVAYQLFPVDNDKFTELGYNVTLNLAKLNNLYYNYLPSLNSVGTKGTTTTVRTCLFVYVGTTSVSTEEGETVGSEFIDFEGLMYYSVYSCNSYNFYGYYYELPMGLMSQPYILDVMYSDPYDLTSALEYFRTVATDIAKTIDSGAQNVTYSCEYYFIISSFSDSDNNTGSNSGDGSDDSTVGGSGSSGGSETGDGDVEEESEEYSLEDLARGQEGFDKIVSDIENDNINIVSATLAVNDDGVLEALLLPISVGVNFQSIAPSAIQMIESLKSSEIAAYGKVLGVAGIFVGTAQTVIALTDDDGTNMSTGEILNAISTALGTAALCTTFIPVVSGTLGVTSAIVGLVSNFFTYEDMLIHVPLDNGKNIYLYIPANAPSSLA